MIKKYYGILSIIICYAAQQPLTAAQLHVVNDITPLMSAISENLPDAVNIIINSGTDINKQDSAGRTALMYAILCKRPAIATLLLKAGADINKQDNEGMSALMCAAAYGYIDSLKVLLKRAPDLNRQDNFGFTALMLAAGRNDSKDSILALLRAGANPLVVSFDAQTISNQLQKKQRTDSEIKRSVSRQASTTFESILMQKNPKLLQDSKIQEHIKYFKEREKQRVEYSRQIVAPMITENIEHVYFPPDLSKIVADYATEKVPCMLETEAVLDQAASCCVIT